VASPDHLGLIFEETAPISTYLFAFAAGKFVAEDIERDGRRFRMLHREPDAAKVARNRDAIVDLHARSLAWLEDYTGIPYPFGKFEFILIPSFQFGGMEHPGAIYYNATSLLLDESATQAQHLGRANLIAHETAHMWFGDLVTMRWFNDVWMKEVFANFMAAKVVNPLFPDVNHELRFLLQHYPAAYDVDRTGGTNPIRQDLDNLNEAGSLYGAIIYQKAPIVMRQLERLLGEDAMRDGLREYLRSHQFGSADWADLVRILDARTPIDLVLWSRAWVEERGRPRIHVDLKTEGGAASVTLTTEDSLGRALSWPQSLTIVAGSRAKVTSTGEHYFPGTATWPVADPLPAWILPNGGGLGYGDFVLAPEILSALAEALPALEHALTRGAALVTLWESMLEGRFAPSAMRAVLEAALPREVDELITAQMLDYLRAQFWRFTAADDRGAAAERIEALLRSGLDRASTTSRKAAWFATLRGVATTPDTIAWLERVWRGDATIPGLPLSETDFADLALELAVRDVANSDAILRGQLERFTSDDRRARFAFVMPAVSGDAAVRAAFFQSLRDIQQRRREAWVLEAVRYLHHPLRAPVSVTFVADALGLVREIQRTGDIFFPKRWADATLGGYQPPRTASDVRTFIDALPTDYPPRLRWILLSAADPLFRASVIAHQ
jgi:aminopeptidase N